MKQYAGGKYKGLTGAQLSILFVLVVILASSVGLYRKHVQGELEWSVHEHADLLAEPMWNLDLDTIDIFISILIARSEYQTLKVFEADNSLLYESQAPELEGIEALFFDFRLIKLKEYRADITKGKIKLGVIKVLWWDRSIYMVANGTLLTLLLFIIAVLYSSATGANRKLKSKISDLHLALEEVKRQKDYIEHIFNVVPEGLITTDDNNRVVAWNLSFDKIVDVWGERLGMERYAVHEALVSRLLEEVESEDEGEYTMSVGGENIHIVFASSVINEIENIERVLSLIDATDMKIMQQRLAQSEKLESVGRLAAGIAHEINTPTQYVTSNVDFFSEAFGDLAEGVKKLVDLTESAGEANNFDFSKRIGVVVEEMDWEYLQEEVPVALHQSKEGLRRIQSIVSAMKQFSHPSAEVAEYSDLNQAVEMTVTVATNEWKYCADLEMRLAKDLPEVPCYRDLLNQVILNMTVNAAHAIEERLGQDVEKRGKIIITTLKVDDEVELSISDDGIGMSKEVQQKVFDPFFTTKAVNKGSGQGLAIANDIIVNKHHGQIKVDSIEGKGTTFRIRLPLALSKG